MTVLATQAKPGLSKDDWCTPACVLERVRRVAPIALDPCTTRANPVRAEMRCVPDDGRARANECVRYDGLRQSWSELVAEVEDGGLCFVNPPYSRGNLKRWTTACEAEAFAGAEIIALLPVDTSTTWWHEHVATATAKCFWRGRLTFVGAPGPAPFASVAVYYGQRKFRFAEAFSDAGSIWI